MKGEGGERDSDVQRKLKDASILQIRDVCNGMAFLHSHQMLHRSLIPHNILIGEHFNAKLSDFVSTCNLPFNSHDSIPILCI